MRIPKANLVPTQPVNTCHFYQVELSRWMSQDTVRTLLFDKMRDAMKEEVNRLMATADPPERPARLTRKQQAKPVHLREQGMASNGAGSATAAAAVDEPPPEVCHLL